MANATIRGAVSIHGTNPQFLIEKPVRARIYESPFWKEHCFALSAATILPLAVSLNHIGGLVGLQRPSHFLCLLQKLLQIQPEPAIINAYLEAREFKYLGALTAFYIRLTYTSKHVYTLLEPMLEDGRKLRWRSGDGAYEILHMDEWVDMLLREERVCDIILPRLTRRDVCETRDGLLPRISKLETSLLKALQAGERTDSSDDEHSDADEDGMLNLTRCKLERLKQATHTWRKSSPQPGYAYDVEAEYTSQEDSDGEASTRPRFISPSPSVSPDRQLQSRARDQAAYLSRSPSRSPDRQTYVSRSPSLSPDRQLSYVDGEERQEAYISRSPSRSPDRQLSDLSDVDGEERQEAYISRSPSRSPDRQLSDLSDVDGEERQEAYISRSPSRSPDRS